MLKKIPGREALLHLCEKIKVGSGVTETAPQNTGKRHGASVMLYDIHPRLFIEKSNHLIPITFCPFCGADIDNEERP